MEQSFVSDYLLFPSSRIHLNKMPAASIKILLVEDDELFRLGLKTRLEREPGMEIVAEAEDGETAVELAKQYPLNLVVLDIGLPGIGGIEACRQLKQAQPNLPILVLTSRTQKSLIVRLIEAGVQGYSQKGVPSETLILAIRSVAAGASWWDSTATAEIRANCSNHSTTSDLEDETNHLTRREQEILALIAAGKTNQEIANLLYIAPGTVRVHVHTILHKLGVNDRTRAAVIAIKKQLIPQELLSDREY
ncbi:two component LuxR family transcriptional regulator [Microseira wollei NIES-4236]|uniref:Two component LuxR family transcriptional regulator n=2 Tax=Microseira wollei TaxID=467598 RepID=A0AAV3X5P5_9CYAN|nr:two component LuxR family transcriptional regulator [Microseira wollei NIES-4236]